MIRLVSQSSADAHVALMKMCRAGLYEYQMESRFLFETGNCGLRQQAYTSIVGAGYNSAILHYIENSQKLQENNIILIDAAGEYNGYGTDITRSYPVNGKWNDQQKTIYTMVLNTQQRLIDMLKPGVSWSSLTQNTVIFTLEELVNNNFIHGNFSELIFNNISRIFLPHGFGHLVGLDVHDPTYSNLTLASGMILTIEPGIYFNDALTGPALSNVNISAYLNADLIKQYENWGGVRIEDTILINDSGYEILSSNAPKDMKGISDVMEQ
eukprot:TRINITY_DN8496_c0_g1_i1.p1 TRINITY_DN8496_c0_g1~~TRINITY_DN8496_c0_g1_i1.p1  ORF type:complete len:314 (-),score=70.12 TRINITY_DN8496_c0_g1_i1:64-867(-)